MLINNKSKACLIGSVFASISIGCAGPTTPFGAVREAFPTTEKIDSWTYFKENFFGFRGPTITFNPSHQILHAPRPLQLRIDDAQGVKAGYHLSIHYNGVDITSSFLSQAELKISDDTRAILITIPTVYLAAAKNHQIEAAYTSADGKRAFAAFMPPTCRAFEEKKISNTDLFQPTEDLLRQIDLASRENGFNPAFTAALIAQESGFNPKTVSIARAVGLTQVTPNADRELSSWEPDWPRFPGLNDLTFLALKGMVISGTVNATNEWRLNPERSIRGGLAYLDLLSERWESPENRRKIRYLFADPEEAETRLLLASYHSGYTRVLTNFRKYSESWLDADDLTAARRYVNRINSFCDQFSHAREGGNREDPT